MWKRTSMSDDKCNFEATDKKTKLYKKRWTKHNGHLTLILSIVYGHVICFFCYLQEWNLFPFRKPDKEDWLETTVVSFCGTEGNYVHIVHNKSIKLFCPRKDGKNRKFISSSPKDFLHGVKTSSQNWEQYRISITWKWHHSSCPRGFIVQRMMHATCGQNVEQMTEILFLWLLDSGVKTWLQDVFLLFFFRLEDTLIFVGVGQQALSNAHCLANAKRPGVNWLQVNNSPEMRDQRVLVKNPNMS